MNLSISLPELVKIGSDGFISDEEFERTRSSVLADSS